MSGALLVCVGWLWLGTSGVSAAGHLVRITGSLDPVSLAVAPGDTITWRNDDWQRHRIRTTSGPGEFDSGDIEPGGSYSVSLTAIGTYAYRDERNRDLAAYWGTVVVSSISATPSPGATTGTPPTAPPTGATIGMAGRAFGPSSVTIVAGGTVTWRNDDDREHTVLADLTPRRTEAS